MMWQIPSLPVITISPLIEGPIIEGDKAQFLISTSQRPTLDLTVYLSYSLQLQRIYCEDHFDIGRN